jgi:hypothetical protein
MNEAGLCLERAVGWSKPQSSRIALPTWNWRWSDEQLADQPLYSDADAQYRLAAQLGINPVNVIGIYACDTASPLVSLVAGGPNLVAAGGPLTQRAANGLLYRGRRTDKLAVESATLGGAERFRAAVNGFGQIPAGTSGSFGVVWRNNLSDAITYDIMGTMRGGAEIGWVLRVDNANLILRAQTTTAAIADYVTIASGNYVGGGWHCAIVAFDGTARTISVFSDVANGGPVGYAGDINNAAGLFGLGFVLAGSISGQWAYVFGLDVLADAAMLARFWTHGSKPSALTAYSRTNTVRTACAASAVSAWSADQFATRYASTFAARRNWRLEGVANDGPFDFMGIGSTDLFANSTGAGGTAVTASVDGVSGMRDGARITMGAAYNPLGARAYFPAVPGAPIVGASNVPWRGDVSYRRATVGVTARASLQYAGDPGGGEAFVVLTDNATPTQWTRGGGTCTPVGAAQTAVYGGIGSANNLEDCDFCEAAVEQGCSVAPDWWVLMAPNAATLVANPASITVSNAADAVLDHAQGSLRIRTAGFSGADTWDANPMLFCASANDGTLNGLLSINRDAANFVVNLRDNAGVLVASWVIGTVALRDGNDHLIQVDWCAAAPVAYVAGVAWYAALYFDGVLQAVGGGGVAPVAGWVPSVGGIIYVNSYDPLFAATYPGRAAIEEVAIFPNPSLLLGTPPVVL